MLFFDALFYAHECDPVSGPFFFVQFDFSTGKLIDQCINKTKFHSMLFSVFPDQQADQYRCLLLSILSYLSII